MVQKAFALAGSAPSTEFAASLMKDGARALRADLVLEGQVVSEGEQVGVQMRMVDAVRDRKLRAKDFAAPAGELGELQRRVAMAISSAALESRRR